MAAVRWGSAAREMTRDDIARVQADFVSSARLARDAGFDIVYVYGAHGYLLTQFLSTWSNRRTDGYGGTLAGRARFALETLEQVRAAVGADCAIATRICVDGRRGVKGVLIERDARVRRTGGSTGRPLRRDRRLVARGLGDVALLPGGASAVVDEPGARGDSQADRRRRPLHEPRPDGRRDPLAARSTSSARRGPRSPTRSCRARSPRVVSTTSASASVQRLHHQGGGIRPRRLHPERDRRRGVTGAAGTRSDSMRPRDPDRAVLVVGAGPAGMECAMVLGRRGFTAVHLVDAEDEIGGRIRWTRRLPTLGDWGRIVDWRRTQLDKLPNVDVITGRRLTTAEVLDYGASVVVVATGSRWSGDGTQPGRLRPISLPPGTTQALTPERVMTGDRPVGQRVAVYDVDGYYVGPGIAELLAAEGYDVHLVTPEPVVSPISDETLEGPLLRQHLHDSRGDDALGRHVLARDQVASRARPSSATRGRSTSTTSSSSRTRCRSTTCTASYVGSAALAAAGITAVHLIGDRPRRAVDLGVGVRRASPGARDRPAEPGFPGTRPARHPGVSPRRLTQCAQHPRRNHG